MTRLLRANFTRLWKSKSFWVCVIMSVAVSFLNDVYFAVLNKEWVYKTGDLITNQVGTTALFIAAIFAPLYLGADYSHGTIRNKLAVGHSRVNSYIASLIPVASGTLIIVAAYKLPLIVMSLIWGKNLGMTLNDFVIQILIIIAAAIAASSIFTLLGMLITSRFITTTVTLVLMSVLFESSSILVKMLEQPEYTYDYNVTETGLIEPEPLPNPRYIKDGALRNILTAVTDVIPNGQVVRLQSNVMHNKELYPLYSLGILAVTTTVGVLVFRRKDLK